jgi:hypothetical protein
MNFSENNSSQDEQDLQDRAAALSNPANPEILSTYKEMIPMTLLAQLDITEADRPNRNIAVRDTATIGRDNDNDIVLELPRLAAT